MSVFAEFTHPADTVPLERTLEAILEGRIELEQIVPVGESMLPFFWVTGPESNMGLLGGCADETSD